MRHPRIHRFLLWFGPISIAFLGGCIGLAAALAQASQRFARWVETEFDAWWPVVSALWFVGGGVAVIALYLAGLFYTGGSPSNRRLMQIRGDRYRVAWPFAAGGYSGAWKRGGFKQMEKKGSDAASLRRARVGRVRRQWASLKRSRGRLSRRRLDRRTARHCTCDGCWRWLCKCPTSGGAIHNVRQQAIRRACCVGGYFAGLENR